MGQSALCPNGIGLYECTVLNGNGLGWIVNGERLVFSSFRQEGAEEAVANTAIIAYLVNVDIESGTFGNRTSILHYEADFDGARNITITCDIGTTNTSCDMDVMVVGKS